MFGGHIEVAVIAAFLVVTTQVTSSLLGTYAAVSKLHWMLRALMVIMLFSPLLVVDAEEMFLLFVIQTWAVALSIHGLRRFGVGPAIGGDRGSVRQFSIGAFAFLTLVVACGVAVWRYLPALNVNGWISLASWNWMAVGCAASAWCFINLEWRPHWRLLLAFGITVTAATPPAMLDWLLVSFSDETIGWPPEFAGWGLFGTVLSRPVVTWYAISAGTILYLALCASLLVISVRSSSVTRSTRLGQIVVIAFAFVAASFPGWIMFRLLTRPAVPQVAFSEAAFRKVVDLGNAINGIPAGSPELDTKIQELRALLDEPLSVPLAYTIDDISTFDITSVRTTSSILIAHGEAQFASGSFDSASQTLLLAVEQGIDTRRGGLLVHMLVGVAMTGSSAPALFRCSEKCSIAERKRVIAALMRLMQCRETSKSFIERDRLWSIQQGWHTHVQHLLNDMAGVTVGVVPMCVEAMDRELAELQLLVTEFAIANYREDHGQLPGHLNLLTPDYLSESFSDPFSPVGDGFKYRVTGDQHVLYSLGPNRIDDGGSSIINPGDFSNCDLMFERQRN